MSSANKKTLLETAWSLEAEAGDLCGGCWNSSERWRGPHSGRGSGRGEGGWRDGGPELRWEEEQLDIS